MRDAEWVRCLLALVLLGAGAVARPDGLIVFMSESEDGVIEFHDQRLSASDQPIALATHRPVAPEVLEAQIAQQLAVAESLASARRERESLRLQQRRLALERRAEERKSLEAETRAREAANYRSWYWRPAHYPIHRRPHAYHHEDLRRTPSPPGANNKSAFFPAGR